MEGKRSAHSGILRMAACDKWNYLATKLASQGITTLLQSLPSLPLSLVVPFQKLPLHTSTRFGHSNRELLVSLSIHFSAFVSPPNSSHN